MANVSLSNIAGESAEGMVVTKPKNYDQVPANLTYRRRDQSQKQKIRAARSSGLPTLRCSLCRRGLNQSADPAEIAKYLKANSVETVMGDALSWDEKGDLKGFEFGVFTRHADGTATDAK